MSTFDRIEEHRDLTAGLEYEERWYGRDPKYDWKRAVIDRDAGCISCHECEGELQAHHVVTQQHLRKHGLSEYAWDRRVGVTLCERAHRRHHSARERLHVDMLPAEVVAFVNGIGLGWYLERHYGAAA